MDPSSVPLLAWHFVAVQNSVNPMLAFCRGDVVYFLLVSPGWSVLLSVVTSHAHIQGLSLYLSDSMIAEHAGNSCSFPLAWENQPGGHCSSAAAVPLPGGMRSVTEVPICSVFLLEV